MGYELPRRETSASTTPGRFLEGVASVYVSPAEIQRQVERTKEVMGRLYDMERISREASLKRQNYDKMMRAQQTVQEPVMAY